MRDDRTASPLGVSDHIAHYCPHTCTMFGCMQVQRPLATITPTLDGDVLAVLVGTDVAFTPGQVARMVPSASVEGIRKVLKRLAEQGIVTVDRVGNAYT